MGDNPSIDRGSGTIPSTNNNTAERPVVESTTTATTTTTTTDKINASDVIFGRGNGILCWPGNIAFRHVVWSHRKHYPYAKRCHKRNIGRQVIHQIKHVLNGRFLMIDPTMNNKYHIVSDERAIDKALQALREKDMNQPTGFDIKTMKNAKKWFRSISTPPPPPTTTTSPIETEVSRDIKKKKSDTATTTTSCSLSLKHKTNSKRQSSNTKTATSRTRATNNNNNNNNNKRRKNIPQQQLLDIVQQPRQSGRLLHNRNVIVPSVSALLGSVDTTATTATAPNISMQLQTRSIPQSQQNQEQQQQQQLDTAASKPSSTLHHYHHQYHEQYGTSPQIVHVFNNNAAQQQQQQQQQDTAFSRAYMNSNNNSVFVNHNNHVSNGISTNNPNDIMNNNTNHPMYCYYDSNNTTITDPILNNGGNMYCTVEDDHNHNIHDTAGISCNNPSDVMNNDTNHPMYCYYESNNTTTTDPILNFGGNMHCMVEDDQNRNNHLNFDNNNKNLHEIEDGNLVMNDDDDDCDCDDDLSVIFDNLVDLPLSLFMERLFPTSTVTTNNKNTL